MYVTLYMAMSLNGIIARDQGEEDFLSNINWHTFEQLAQEYGGFIVGRKTYEAVQQWNEDFNFETISNVKRIVVSRDMSFDPGSAFIAANSPKESLEKAEAIGLQQILLVGGSTLNSQFFKQKLVDEVILNIEPCIMGRGISVFAQEDIEARLDLKNCRMLEEGIVQLHYYVNK